MGRRWEPIPSRVVGCDSRDVPVTVSRWEQRVDVLGPVIVRGAGGIVPLTRSMEIAVLSLLPLRAGSPVGGDSLIRSPAATSRVCDPAGSGCSAS